MRGYGLSVRAPSPQPSPRWGEGVRISERPLYTSRFSEPGHGGLSHRYAWLAPLRDRVKSRAGY